jgi:hypothetical protein
MPGRELTDDELTLLGRSERVIDGLLDRISEGVEVTIYPNGEKTWSADPVAGTYRLVPWDISQEATT